MDTPLEMHKLAFKAAEVTRCAAEQKKYWEMHDQFFTNQRTLKPENWEAYGQVVGLEKLSFQQCIDSGRYASEIRKDMAEGQSQRPQRGHRSSRGSHVLLDFLIPWSFFPISRSASRRP